MLKMHQIHGMIFTIFWDDIPDLLLWSVGDGREVSILASRDGHEILNF